MADKPETPENPGRPPGPQPQDQERARQDQERARQDRERQLQDQQRQRHDQERARQDQERQRLDQERENRARAERDQGQGQDQDQKSEGRDKSRPQQGDERNDQDRQQRGGDDQNRRRESPPEPPDSGIDKKRLKKRARVFVLILVAVAVVLAVWGVVSRLTTRSDLQKRTARDAELTVITTKPELSGAGDELVLPGTVMAYAEAPIYARTSGYVRTWYTDIGSKVRKGQLLALIETPEVDRQLKQAEADLGTAQANLNLSLTTNERWRRLLVTQSVSKQDAEEKAGDAAAKKASADSAAENVERLRELEGFKRVLAPFAGVVTARNTDIGYLINAGESTNTELFRVADTHKLRIYAQVPEAYAEATKTGVKAELHFQEHPGQGYPAETVRTSDALDPSARTLQVELQLDNEKGEFFPGAYTEVHFKIPASMQTMRLPSNTVLFRASGLQVATVDRDHKIKLKTVKQGRDFGKTIEILDGIDVDDEVVVNPSDSAIDGTPVRLAQPPPAPTQSTPSSS